MQPRDRICVLTGIGRDFPGGSDGKESAYNVGDPGWLSGSGRSPGEGNGNLLQYSCLGNAMDRGVWYATAHGVPKNWIGLFNYHFHIDTILKKERKEKKNIFSPCDENF